MAEISYAKKSADEVVSPKVSQFVDDSQEELGQKLPLWSTLPFVGILLSVALIPMLAPVFWHHHYPKVSFAWALIFAIPFLIAYGGRGGHEILHIIVVDYLPFIILLFGLFTVSGGVYVKGTFAGRPPVNLLFLTTGTILASWMGTTGAAMLLIRPLIRANRMRKYKVHTVIFFIFLVANIGGTLTPIGDPPLFLGFLHGVPFFWTLKLLPEMLTATILILIVYILLDLILYRREAPVSEDEKVSKVRFSIAGCHNFLLLAVIVAAVIVSGIWNMGEFGLFGVRLAYQDMIRDLFILTAALISLVTTKSEDRKANGFTWFPIREVAYLFFGIFITISAPLSILRAGSEGAAAFLTNTITSPAHFFWASGALSSFLDNAPTYLTFFNLALGKLAVAPEQVAPILEGIVRHPQGAQFALDLAAISCGSVFFGAMSYIGNAPNFMVRSIAEENRVKMPSFSGYMLWSCGILIPSFIVITMVFF